ncbi:hypothetical protein V5799_003889 [Amblyomma americanum]|uniref:Uncharacterized protein n=1 Tax=Amblyomma americanum TaxID=6943 RepID=A0AAQ4D7N8_AMBAM
MTVTIVPDAVPDSSNTVAIGWRRVGDGGHSWDVVNGGGGDSWGRSVGGDGWSSSVSSHSRSSVVGGDGWSNVGETGDTWGVGYSGHNRGVSGVSKAKTSVANTVSGVDTESADCESQEDAGTDL